VGYRLPALVERGILPRLQGHLVEGRQVFVLVVDLYPDLAPPGPIICQVWLPPGETMGASGLLLSDPAARPRSGQLTSWDRFTTAWNAAGNLQLVAAQGWGDLPTQGNDFFGGTREADGAYRWDTAECETDGTGRVLRFS